MAQPWRLPPARSSFVRRGCASGVGRRGSWSLGEQEGGAGLGGPPGRGLAEWAARSARRPTCIHAPSAAGRPSRLATAPVPCRSDRRCPRAQPWSSPRRQSRRKGNMKSGRKKASSQSGAAAGRRNQAPRPMATGGRRRTSAARSGSRHTGGRLSPCQASVSPGWQAPGLLQAGRWRRDRSVAAGQAPAVAAAPVAGQLRGDHRAVLCLNCLPRQSQV